MTKLKIKENVGNANPVTANFNFNGIEAGDMFYCYDSDVTVMVIDEDEDQWGLIDLTCGERISDSENEHVSDVFQRLIEQQGDFYPVRKATLKFTVGE